MAKHHVVLCIVIALTLAMGIASLGDVPRHISFQGKLHDNAGNPLTGLYEVTFRIYSTQSGGSALWSETMNVQCENGLYNVILGKTNPITLNFDGQYYLGVQVTGDSELSPRYEFTSVPGAFRAAVADSSATSASAVEADKVDGKDAAEFAASDHQHDDRYYTETELKTNDGSVNEAGDPVSWFKIKDMPAGFADGTDEVGTTGEGISQINEGTGITVTNPTGPTATVAADIGTGADQVAAGNHTHHSLNAADSNPTNAVYVDNDGNVGIGTTSPDVNLHVQGSEYDEIKVESTVSWGNASLIAKTSGGMNDYLQLYKGGPTTSGSTAGGIPLANLSSLSSGIGAGPLMLQVISSNPMYFVTSNQERMRITSDGNVGIGTTDPSLELHVGNGGGLALQNEYGGGASVEFLTTDGSGMNSQIYSDNTGLTLWTDSGRDILLTAGSNVGIGTASPAEKLHIAGTLKVDDTLFANTVSSNSPLSLQTDGTTRLYIDDASGNVGIGTMNPGAGLVVAGDGLWNSAIGIIDRSNGATEWRMNVSGSTFGITKVSGSTFTPFRILVDSFTDALVLGAEGVGVGVLNPQHRFHVEGEESEHAEDGHAVGYFKNTVTEEDAAAVYGECANTDYYGFGGFFTGGYTGVKGQVLPTGSSSYYGVYGGVEGGSGTNYGVYGYVSGSGTNWAGYFSGDVYISGDVLPAAGSCKIDHPLDPENKYLSHSFVESPDMMNVYNGNVTLNAKGEAVVELPDYFEAFNRDFRYQLTAIGAAGPNLHIAQKISGNRFKIAGGKPGMEVSWQVTGIRQDAYANAHRMPVEEEKSVEERGKYLHPEEYGQPETMGIEYEERQKIKQSRTLRSK
ncbi:MAG: hypothetical protein JSV84_14435 [Gemmatimonadota bacterium]|nr:MAG: hypothetical protein JSV84_14435 [Gemmatimonadota bacterium]